MRTRLVVRSLFADIAVLISISHSVHAQTPIRTLQLPESTPLPNAHAHNDYEHPRPLLDALDHGFCSVEADIYLVDGQLLVGHDREDLRPHRTLQSLYLDPLRTRAASHGGRIHPEVPTVTLLIDFKTEGEATYGALREVLDEYRELLGETINGEFRPGAVQIVISGNRPFQTISDDADRRVGIDGRLSDLDSSMPAHLMPLISDRWGAHFQWNGVGTFPADQREKLHEIVRRAHAAGRRVRFWATPETPAMWSELVEAGVDHVNTDQLDQLKDFLLTRH